MKTKLVKLLTVLFLVLICAIAFSACKHEHEFGEYHFHRNATCTEDVTKIAYCRGCSETSTVTEPGTALGHRFKNYISNNDAACTKIGTETAKCERCDETDTRRANLARGHNWGEYKSNNDATCDKNATMTARCKICNAVNKVVDDGSALGHDFIDHDEKLPTCTEKGWYAYETCGRDGCEYSTYEELPALGHDHSKRAYSETQHWLECVRGDGKIEIESHTLNVNGICNACGYGCVHEEETAATCETQAICSKCGNPYGDILGHSFTNYISNGNATLTTDGTKTAKCDRCEKTDTITEVDSSWLEFTLNSSKTAYGITELRNKSLAEIIIPDKYNGLPVTWIDYGTFKDCTSLASIIIPDSVTSIGAYAFSGCVGLGSITFRENSKLETIGTYAFSDCTSLASIIIPDSVKSIGVNAFEYCTGLKNVKFGADSKLERIEEYAFMNCTSLESIMITSSVASVGSSVFKGCTGLTSITVPFVRNHFGYIFGASSYSDNKICVPSSLKTVVITGGESIDKYAFSSCTGINSITIHDSVTSIGYGAFEYCTALESITIPFVGATVEGSTSIRFEYIFGTLPSSLKTVVITGGKIDTKAFYNCRGIENITILDSVTNIGDSAFQGCTGLRSITLPYSVNWLGRIFGSTVPDDNRYVPSSLHTVIITGGKGVGGFEGCGSIRNITLPESLTVIGDYAFYGCYNLTNLNIPESVTKIGEYAFYNCRSLTSITIPAGVTQIDYYTFYGCSGLTSLEFSGNSLYYIYSSAFYGCKGLTNIEIPDSVKSIGESAFEDCWELTSITIPFVGNNSSNYSGYDCFGYIFGASSYEDNSKYVPSSLKTVVITGGDAIYNNAFYQCEKIESITLPESITEIGKYAFYNCYELTDLNIPESVTRIGEYAFYKCTGIESITISSSVKSIGVNAFEYCTGLKNVKFGADSKLERIEEYAFMNCTSLESIMITSSVASVGSSVFKGCTGLTSITVPFVRNHFGYIFGASSHSDNKSCVPSSLKTVIITGGESIGEYAFSDCSGINSITISASVTSIGANAFKNCTELDSITVASGNTVYHSDGNCLIETESKTLIVGLKNSIIPTDGSVTRIGVGAFNGCRVESIVIPDAVISIDDDAFLDCRWLRSITIPFVGSAKDGAGNIKFKSIFGKTVSYGSNSVPASLETVIIKGGESIYDRAFSGCTGLVSVEISNSVISIGESAFSGCTGITSIEIPNSITSIGDYAFKGCTGSGSVTFGEGSKLESIGNSAFNGCTGLESIDIPASVTSIGDYAFTGTGIESIDIPASVTSIGSYAFYGCTGLESITVDSENTSYHSVGNCLIETESGVLILGLKNSIIPNDGSVTSIGDYAFKGCTGLESIDIPASVTSIGDYAFDGCTGLESIDIPASVTSIGSSAFDGCTGSGSVTFGEGSKLESIGVQAFYGCTGLTSITIPDSVERINESAFGGCTGLKSVIFGENSKLESIIYTAFAGCKGLKNIEIPASVTSIGAGAFNGCTGLVSIKIPFVGATKNGTENTHFGYIFGASSYSYNDAYVPTTLKTVIITGGESIGASAFRNCTSLKSITIPNSVISIGASAFNGCTGLVSIKIPFVGATKNETQYTNFGYIFGASSYYYNDDYVPTSLKTVIISGGASIDDSAFEGCVEIESITIPDSVMYIGEKSFYNCTGLESVTFENNSKLESIYTSAFEGCTAIKSIKIPNSVINIGGNAFYNCTGLENITFEKNSKLESIGFVFVNCTGLISIKIPESVKSIEVSAFYGCPVLESIVVASENTVYHSEGNCLIETESRTLILGLKNSIIPNDGSVISIGDSAFYYCTGLESITIPNGVTSIGASAFNGCTGLKSVTFGKNSELESIGNYAFYGCTGLESMEIPDGVKSINIGNSAFSGCSALVNVTISDSVKSIGSSAFSKCTSLESITLPFVGANEKTSSDTYQYPFGYIFGTSSYTGGVETKQYYYGSSTSSTTYDTYYIPSSLKNVTITGGKILYGAFFGCKNIESITLPSNITSIGGYAFSYCTSLASIVIPNSVTNIYSYAFYDCTGLTSVTFENTSGWLVSTTIPATSVTNVDVTNAVTNATYLTVNYYGYYWERR